LIQKQVHDQAAARSDLCYYNYWQMARPVPVAPGPAFSVLKQTDTFFGPTRRVSVRCLMG